MGRYLDTVFIIFSICLAIFIIIIFLPMIRGAQKDSIKAFREINNKITIEECR